MDKDSRETLIGAIDGRLAALAYLASDEYVESLTDIERPAAMRPEALHARAEQRSRFERARRRLATD